MGVAGGVYARFHRVQSAGGLGLVDDLPATTPAAPAAPEASRRRKA
jgi:hypothetical protein